MTSEMKPVKFIVGLYHDIDKDPVKNELELLATDLPLNLIDSFPKTQLWSTTKTAYESLFNAKIEYQSRTVETKENSRIRTYQISNWVELKPAQIPDCLTDKIRYIILEQEVGLED